MYIISLIYHLYLYVYVYIYIQLYVYIYTLYISSYHGCLKRGSAFQVPLNALVAEGLLRNLPKVPEGLEVVPVPREMEDLAVTWMRSVEHLWLMNGVLNIWIYYNIWIICG